MDKDAFRDAGTSPPSECEINCKEYNPDGQ